MPSKPRIIFDTSGLNALASDPNGTCLIPSLSAGFHPRITETCANEIAATKSRDARLRLLDVCRRVASIGDCILPYNEILRRMTRAHAANPSTFDWRAVDVLWPNLIGELNKHELFHDDTFSREARGWNKALNAEYLMMWREVRPLAHRNTDDESPITIEDVFEVFGGDESPGWGLAADMYENPTGVKLSKKEARAFANLCPPMKAALYSQAVGQYHWAAKPELAPATYKAGALDLFSGAYLPFCEKFITNDEGQYHALKRVTEKIGIATDVWLYRDFVSALLIAA
jgi:hypothetical protein